MTAATKSMTATAPGVAPEFADLRLDDKFDLAKARIFVTGSQAIVRLLMMQKARDAALGLNTAGFVTGYRGSPLGALDQQMTRAKRQLDAADVVFTPGLNEELAATAVWGTQQAEMRGEGRFDGVFSIWYAKGPGVDRSGDVFRHANLAGTSKHGGVLALMGDDHTAESSTTAHQSELRFVDVGMPILNPAGVQEIIDYGLYGWSLSRWAGVWVGLKCLKDTVESTASIDASLDRVQPVTPDDFAMPGGGLNIRPRDPVLTQEARLHDHKRDAVLAWLRANKLDRVVTGAAPGARIGVVASGKSYLDVRQALEDLGLADDEAIAARGLRLYKVACSYPLEPDSLKAFADGLDLVICVEEKRGLIETQLREELYHAPTRPLCIGKKDEAGATLFPVKGALDPNDIAVVIGERLLRYRDDPALAQRVEQLKGAQQALARAADIAPRAPWFCSGCPHNTSTRVPDGMRAYAGIGCHYMVQWMDRATEGFTQMGGEGANWVGEAPFSTREHVFQNLGDGTYNHSGALAIRWAVGTKTRITYKILFNDAVAMTGGQAHDGGLTVPQIARQVAAEGVSRIAIVAEDPEIYDPHEDWPTGATVHPRSAFDAVQRELAALDGCTVIIFDQTCAAEKRRRRKRRDYPDPDRRVLINAKVCEGCGDCGVQSNCVSVQPLETPFGRKRVIDQSSCNKDFSCLQGFCPSFVTVEGGAPRKTIAARAPAAAGTPDIPEPVLKPLGRSPYAILVTGVGGTGVVTIGAILGMAAHLEGRGCGVIDMAGIAQKGGAVYSHVKLAARPQDITAIRVAAAHADLVLGCDLMVTGASRTLATLRRDATQVVVNTAEIYPGDFTSNADYRLPAARLERAIREAGGDGVVFVDATGEAKRALGDAIAANMFMLGFAWQRGAVPLSREALRRAIELNGEAVAMNLAAFEHGRARAHAPAPPPAAQAPPAPEPLEALVDRFSAELVAYQNAAYAERYRARVARIAQAERGVTRDGAQPLAEAVARGLFKLMAMKDEYEVARLYANGDFLKQAREAFEGDLRFTFHLAPPLLAPRDKRTGLPGKISYGGWMMHAFRLLAPLKRLRFTPFDVFGRTQERRAERALLAGYEATLDAIAARLTPATYETCLALAALPEKVRGFGHVRARHMAVAEAEQKVLLARLEAGEAARAVAAE